MPRLKMGIFIALISLGITAPVASQAQSWVEDNTTYSLMGVHVTESGTGHHSIGAHSTYGGVNAYADPPSGGSSDIQVDFLYNWHWTGTVAQLVNLSIEPNGDLAGTCPWPITGADLSSGIDTRGLSLTYDINMKPGPYGSPVVGTRQSFAPAPPSLTISVAGTTRAVATLPSGPFSNGASSDAVLYWMQ